MLHGRKVWCGVVWLEGLSKVNEAVGHPVWRFSVDIGNCS